MKRAAFSWGTWLPLATLVFSFPSGRAVAATLDVGDSPGATCATSTPSFTKIQDAVDFASQGDTIEVCPGTYAEQVTIMGTGKNNLTLKSKDLSDPAMIKAPAAVAEFEFGQTAVVLVTGATGVTIKDLMISGPGPIGCGSLSFGIYVGGNGSATIDGNIIQDIRDDPFSGCQNGIGVQVGSKFLGEVGNATVENNTIQRYQKAGIVVDNAGSNATITGNTVTGAGRTQTIAQNGIQVSRGATASIASNSVSDNFFLNSVAGATGCPADVVPFLAPPTGICLATGTGILFFESGSAGDRSQLVTQNTLRGNQLKVSVIP